MPCGGSPLLAARSPVAAAGQEARPRSERVQHSSLRPFVSNIRERRGGLLWEALPASFWEERGCGRRRTGPRWPVQGCVRLRVLLGNLASRVPLPVVKPSDNSSSQAPGGLSTDSHPQSAPPPLPSPRPGTFRSHGLLPGQTHPGTGLVSRHGGHGGGSSEPSSGAYLGSTGQRGPLRPRGPLGVPGLPCLLSRPPPMFSSQRFRPGPPRRTAPLSRAPAVCSKLPSDPPDFRLRFCDALG